ncbi:MAG: hypothetical protein IJZ30_03960 [Alphaproteobacteria bacterium]|nr:hypothetical protein [Alphaproteobacteria bacterium]
MSENNKAKLEEQLIRCVLDDKLSDDMKLKKMDYIIRLGASVNAKHKTGYSLYSLAKIMGNEKIINFLDEKGAVEEKKVDIIDPEYRKRRIEMGNFFKDSSIDEINMFLRILPEGFKLDCNIDLSNRELTELPDFSKVWLYGNFNCSNNRLVILKGAPKHVLDFYCSKNHLTTLEGISGVVNGKLVCSHNELVSLEGGPQHIAGEIYLDHNHLTSLKGLAYGLSKVDCSYNELETLEGAPTKVIGDFICSNNKLKTLEFAPKEVAGNFICSNNKLKTLEKGPQRVLRGNYDCSDNDLENLEGASEWVQGDFLCYNNPLKSTKGKPNIISGMFKDGDMNYDDEFETFVRFPKIER